jgi:hypothetical protein
MIDSGQRGAGPVPATASPDAWRWRKGEPRLALGRYRLSFRVEEPEQKQGYPGSAWRGVFGHSLRKLVCVTRQPECPGCLLLSSCLYPYIFETFPPPGSAHLRKYKALPHPFILGVHPYASGEPHHQLGVTLVGQANRYAAYVIQAFRLAGERGLKGYAKRLVLESVDQEEIVGTGRWQRIYEDGSSLAPLPVNEARWPDPPSALKLSLRTPLRLRFQAHLVTPDTFHPGVLLRSLIRRLSSLCCFHGTQPLEMDFAAAAARAAALRATTDLRWKEWSRYSSRQKTRMEMGGLLGTIAFEGEQWREFWPFFWMGQWVHAGKGATMGLGRYEIISG